MPPKIPVTVVPSGGRFDLGPFNVEFIPVAHSIPESHALAIRTEVGTVLHTGDWKIDPTPIIGPADRREAPARAGRRRRAGAGRRFHQRGARWPFAVGGRGRKDHHRAHRGRAGPRCGHDLRLQRRPRQGGRAAAAQGRRPRGRGGRPCHGARRRRSRANAAISTACRISAAWTSTAISRATRCWRCAPAARASRAPRWRASPTTTIRR